MKGRFSFVGKKHTLKIDADIWQQSLQYVKDQLAILKRYGSDPQPPLTQQEEEDMAYAVTKYPQTVHNLKKKVERKKAREARKGAAASE